jgi:hypothetical protein
LSRQDHREARFQAILRTIFPDLALVVLALAVF